MRKSVLLIGLGRFGRYTAKKLHEMDIEVMAVDRDEERVANVLDYTTNAMIGDGSDEAFIGSIGVSNYDVCIVAIGDDFLNSLETTALLNEYGAKFVVARATMDSQEKFLLRNGADAVVFPERQMGNWTAIRYGCDNVENFIDLGDGFAIYEIKVPEEWVGQKIGDLEVRRKYHLNILGVRDGDMHMDITYETVIRKYESLLVLGKTQDLEKVVKSK